MIGSKSKSVSSISFVTGGTLPISASSYVNRRADAEILGSLLGGEFCYVLDSRQMGKSSLMVRTAQRLSEQGIISAVVDLNAFGSNLTSQQWYRGLLNHVGQQLDLEDELDAFWEDNDALNPLQRWLDALKRIVLPHAVRSKREQQSDVDLRPALVIFVDEIDMVRSLRFASDDFLAGIRHCYTCRAVDPLWNDVCFCLLGVASPSALIANPRASPFNVARRIEVQDFSAEEAAPLAQGLGRRGVVLLQRILYWTSGHPYLTQELCRAAAESKVETGEGVDHLCDCLFFTEEARASNDNLTFVSNSLLKSEVDLMRLLDLYEQTRTLTQVVYQETNPLCDVLRKSGVVAVKDGRFAVRNRIYAHVFDETWIEQYRDSDELGGRHRTGRLNERTIPAAMTGPPPHNLPAMMTSFIGRQKAIADIKQLLSEGRLLTLTGSGGSGKTRLSIQVAQELLSDYPDGVWLIEFAALSDPALVVQTIANVIGVREEVHIPLIQTLARSLKPKCILLVLDNCEHLLTAASSAVSALLHACPDIRILVTSREGMGVPGELQFRVPCLSLPHATCNTCVAELCDWEATQLFVERARDCQPSFAPTSRNVAMLVSICHRLDGIPLAVELAAARVRSLSVDQIHSGLDQCFRVLTEVNRAVLARQRTLKATIDWSYDLLTEEEKALLCRLSVFAGGWNIEAAVAVGVGHGVRDSDVPGLLKSLTGKSLVVAVEDQAQTRFRLQETIRQYARDRMRERGESWVVRERHQAYFVTLAEEAEPELTGPGQSEWLNRLEREHDNLRAAMEWSNRDSALRVAGAVWRFWEVRGYLREGRERLEATLATCVDQTSATSQAKALNAAGELARSQCEFADARNLHTQCLTLHQKLGDKRGIATSNNNLGVVAFYQGDYAGARSMYEESLSIRHELADSHGIAETLHNLGNLAGNQGDYSAARKIHAESLELFRALGDRGSIARALLGLGSVTQNQGACIEAGLIYEESLVILRELGNKSGIAFALHNLSSIAMNRDDYATAQGLSEESLALKRELGNLRDCAASLNALGDVAYARGDYASARILQSEGLAIQQELGDRPSVAYSLHNLGMISFSTGDYCEARSLLKQSLEILGELGDKGGCAASLEAFAALADATRQEFRAPRLWGAAQALREKIGSPLPPMERSRYDCQVERARSAMSDADFAYAWSVGRTMSADQAILLALNETSEPHAMMYPLADGLVLPQ